MQELKRIKSLVSKIWPQWEVQELSREDAWQSVYIAQKEDLSGISQSIIRVIPFPNATGSGFPCDSNTQYCQSKAVRHLSYYRHLQTLPGFNFIPPIMDDAVIKYQMADAKYLVLFRHSYYEPATIESYEDLLSVFRFLCHTVLICRDNNVICGRITQDRIYGNSCAGFFLEGLDHPDYQTSNRIPMPSDQITLQQISAVMQEYLSSVTQKDENLDVTFQLRNTLQNLINQIGRNSNPYTIGAILRELNILSASVKPSAKATAEDNYGYIYETQNNAQTREKSTPDLLYDDIIGGYDLDRTINQAHNSMQYATPAVDPQTEERSIEVNTGFIQETQDINATFKVKKKGNFR